MVNFMWMVHPKCLFTCALKHMHGNIILCNASFHAMDMALACEQDMGSIFGMLLSGNIISNVIVVSGVPALMLTLPCLEW